MNISELTHLIETCGKFGVSHVKLDGIGEFRFGAELQQQQFFVPPTETIPLRSEIDPEDEVRVRQQELEDLVLEDPLEFERQLAEEFRNEYAQDEN